MAIKFNQLKNATQTSNSTKPVFPRYYTTKRRLNKLRIFVTLTLLLAVSFWGFAYYKFLHSEPYSDYARKIELQMVTGTSLRDPNKQAKTEFLKTENVFTQIKVKNGKNFDANITYLNNKGEAVNDPIRVAQIVGEDTRSITFDALRYGSGKYTALLSINGTDYLSKDFEIK